MDLNVFLRDRKKAYQFALSPNSPAGKIILNDLANFCRAAETCVVVDKTGAVDRDKSLILEGRREVWLRIQQHLHLPDELLMQIYGGLVK